MSKIKKQSPVWIIPFEELQILLDKSNSLKEVLKHLNLNPNNGNHKTLNKRIKEEKLCLKLLKSNFNKNKKNIMKYKSYSNEEVFCENSTYNRSHLKKRIIKQNLIEYKCDICKCQNIWRGKTLSLQLDHINGINNDNRIENLRFLCPNCHSQTESFSGKRHKHFCKNCNKRKISKKYGKLCGVCLEKTYIKNRKFNPTKDELIKILINNKWNFKSVGRYYNVSDNAIRKRCKKYNII